MTSLFRNKFFDRQLFILTAGLLLDAHSASRPDPQEQARALLLGKPEEGSVAQSAIALNSTRDGALSISAQDRRAYTDSQESARRMILGPGAPAIASRHAAGEWAGSSVGAWAGQ